MGDLYCDEFILEYSLVSLLKYLTGDLYCEGVFIGISA